MGQMEGTPDPRQYGAEGQDMPPEIDAGTPVAHDPTSPAWRAARRSVSVLFFVSGAVFAGWASNISAVQQALHLETGLLGMVLLALSIGAVMGMMLAGWLASSFGSGRVTVVSALLFCVALPLLALAPDSVWLAVALGFFGAADGAMDVTMNAQASEVERLGNRPVMSSFHALFSLGALAGWIFTAAATALDVSPPAHLAVLAVLGLLAALAASPHLLRPAAARLQRRTALTLPPAVLLALGGLGFVVLLCEGAATQWSAVYLHNDLGVGPELAGAGYGAFSLTMGVGRLFGDRLVHRIGPVAVVRGSAALAAVGLGVGLLIGHPVAAVIGFAALGLGCSNVVPVLFSAAGRTPGIEPTAAMAIVTVIGYSAFLFGPTLIGLVAQAASLGAALGLLVVGCGMAAVFASVVGVGLPAARTGREKT